jgi:hypothetical protein
MEIGAFGVSRLGRDAIQALSFQAWISRGATMDAVDGGISVARATGSAFCGSRWPLADSSSYF